MTTDKLKTMHETYGEPNDEAGKHLCCDKCGYCLTCGDCGCLGKWDNEKIKHKTTDKPLSEKLQESLDLIGWARNDTTADTIKRDVKQKIQEAYKELEKDEIKYPVGCHVKFSPTWGECGEISFSNKIILCPDCAFKILLQFQEHIGNEKKVFKSVFGEERLK
jgi:hypothetical protein